MRTVLTATCLAMLLAGGCARHATPIATRAQLSPAEKDFEALWQASLHTLQRYRFVIDRTDRRAGVIETFPMTAQQWFEFWRKDAVTCYDLAEGSLQGVTRRARVRIAPEQPATAAAPTTQPAPPRGYRLSVEVVVAREGEEISITETIDGYNMFILPGREESARHHLQELGRIPEEEAGGKEEKPAGRVITQDRALANRITRDIRRAVSDELARLQ